MKYKKNIEKLMKKQGLNQKTLALEAGLGETAVRAIIKGISGSPRLSTLQKIAQHLGVTVGQIIGEEPSPLLNGPTSQQTLDVMQFVDEWLAANGKEIKDAAKKRDLIEVLLEVAFEDGMFNASKLMSSEVARILRVA